jgi:adenylate kinase
VTTAADARTSRRIVVTGVQAVGKSSLCAHFAGLPHTAVKEMGQEMAREGADRGILAGYEDLPALEYSARVELQKVVASRIREDRTRLVLVAAHLFVSGPEGYVPGFPEAVIDALDLSGIILLTAPPRQIVDRRTTQRPGVPAEAWLIQRELDIVQASAVHTSMRLGIPVAILDNPDGALDQTIAKTRAIIAAAVAGPGS